MRVYRTGNLISHIIKSGTKVLSKYANQTGKAAKLPKRHRRYGSCIEVQGGWKKPESFLALNFPVLSNPPVNEISSLLVAFGR